MAENTKKGADEKKKLVTRYITRAFSIGDGPLGGPGEVEVPEHYARVIDQSPGLVDLHEVAEHTAKARATAEDPKVMAAQREKDLDEAHERAEAVDAEGKELTDAQAKADEMFPAEHYGGAKREGHERPKSGGTARKKSAASKKSSK